MILLRWHMIKTNHLKLTSTVMWLSTIAITATVFFQYGTLLGLQAGTVFIVCLLLLKCLETNTYRDAFIIITVSWVLIFINLLHASHLAHELIALLSVLIALSILRHLHTPKNNLTQLIKKNINFMIIAFPVVVILFFLFPRLPGPIWSLPTQKSSGKTGLSAEMSPGNISNLSMSYQIVFRAKFENSRLPEKVNRYWRGPVLDFFDGRTWRSKNDPRNSMMTMYSQKSRHDEDDQPLIRSKNSSNTYFYQLWLEPHDQRWLFSLDYPLSKNDSFVMSQAGQLILKQTATRKSVYSLESDPDALFEENDLSHSVLKKMLQLPDQVNPKTRAIGEALKDQYGNNYQNIISEAMTYFKKKNLVYTLRPPVLISADTMDEFLFKTKQGFCEHFSSAFTVLLRSAGVPSRIVTGYQGGEINPVDNIMTIRQSDAHAWVEAWIPQVGWVRLDPTGLSAPSRIINNLASALGNNEDLPFLIKNEWEWLKQLTNNWDAISSTWNHWVIGFDFKKQASLLSLLNINSIKKIVAILIIGFSLILLVVSIVPYRYAYRNWPYEKLLWIKSAQKFKKVGLHYQTTEPPKHFLEKVENLTIGQEKITQFKNITKLYLKIRYEKQTQKRKEKQVEILKRNVKKFQIKRKRS